MPTEPFEIDAIKAALRQKLELERMLGADMIKTTVPVIKPDIPKIRKPKTSTIAPDSVKPRKSLGPELDALREKCLACEKCRLSETRNNVVFGEGNPDADLLFIGEGPGYQEDMKGMPFIGPAGQLLTKIIKAIDLEREDVFITNIVKCRPPKNRNPHPDEIEPCWKFLKEQIRLIKPKIICALGAPAAKTLLDRPSEGIGRLRGRFHDFYGTPVMPTFHPAYLLRQPDDKGKCWEDMQQIRDFLKENG